MSKLEKSEETVLIIDSQKGAILLELEAKLNEIDLLKKEVSNKEKVYEVKIERVIDSRDRISELQNVIKELEMQLKQYGEERDGLTE